MNNMKTKHKGGQGEILQSEINTTEIKNGSRTIMQAKME